jgi:hypothetical protein
MPKQVLDRTIGFFKKNLETMDPEKRFEYLNRRLRRIVQYAYRHSTAIKNKMDSVGLKPKDIRTVKDLEKIPITKKAELMDLQKKNPPLGGFTSHQAPSMNPAKLSTMSWGGLRGCMQRAFALETLPSIHSVIIWFLLQCRCWITLSSE